MNNFEKYFTKPRSRGFAKNFETWKIECEDFKQFTGTELAEEVYLFYNPSKNLCQHPECNNKTKFISLGRGFEETCCRVHSMELTSLRKYGVKYKSQLTEFRDAVKNTVKERYGCSNIFQSTEIKEKIKSTNLEKYGFENAMKNQEVKNKCTKVNIENNGGMGFQTGKSKATMLEKYGVDNPSQVDEFQEKKKQTFIENYGVDNPMKNKEIQEKVKVTNLEKYGVENIFEYGEFIRKRFNEKYGVDNPMQLEEIRQKVSKTRIEKYSENHWMKDPETIEKRKLTYIERFGVDHPMQNIEIFEKNLNSCYRRKEYIWKTGEVSFLQGNEPIVLKELEESGYCFNDVKTQQDDMPVIWYYFKGIKRRYFPDFYIPSENLIIEVKSSFTLKGEKNSLKFQAVKDAGFEFRLEVR